VYEGDKSFYKEEDETKPVNVYGKSKVASENYVKSNYSNYAILRSSIIYGPQPVVPVPKSLPLQVGIPNSQNVQSFSLHPSQKKKKKNIKTSENAMKFKNFSNIKIKLKKYNFLFLLKSFFMSAWI
jgi:hypothetical protein